MKSLLSSLFLLLVCSCLFSQSLALTSTSAQIILHGRVLEQKNAEPVNGANVTLSGTQQGTTSNATGYFSLILKPGTYHLLISHVGFQKKQQAFTVPSPSDQDTLLIRLQAEILPGEKIDIQAERDQAPVSKHEIAPRAGKTIPSPLPDALQMVKTLPGVNSLNDQSNFYSVHGGSFIENLIYLNGFEIELPYLVRKGIMENPSPVNENLIQRLNFLNSGFPVQYDDKMSSALDIAYREHSENEISITAQVSTVGVQATLEMQPHQRVHVYTGGRWMRYGNLFSRNQIKGSYEPDYRDAQAGIDFSPHDNIKFNLLWIGANSQFIASPQTASYSTSGQFFTTHNSEITGKESLRYEKQITGLYCLFTPAPSWQQSARLMQTANDEEEYSSTKQNFVSYTESFDPRMTHEIPEAEQMWRSSDVESYFNSLLRKSQLHIQHDFSGAWQAKTGVDYKWFQIDDDLYEAYATNDTALTETLPPIVDRQQKMRGHIQSGFFSLRWKPRPQLEVEGGLRWSKSSLHDENLYQPRLLTRLNLKKDVQVWLSAGRYAQPPIYREFLYHATHEEPLRAQKLTQYAGTIAMQRQRYDLRLTIYRNQWHDLISYDLKDVRLVFSGENDAKGYAYGADAQLRAELLPGIMHWISYSYMVAREDLLDDDKGPMPRPTDVRHTLAIYSEDEMEKWQHSRFHLRAVFSSGYPITQYYWRTVNGTSRMLVPQNRLAGRLPFYMRFDVGLTQNFKLKNCSLQLKEEILNLFDKANIIGYDYLYGARVLDTLASRVFNLSLRVDL